MSDQSELPRSPELMSIADSALLVVDVQEKLIPLVPGHERIVWNIRRLIDGANILGVPVIATEQYPQGLGPTVPELVEGIGQTHSKLAFSCVECTEVFDQLGDRGIHKLLVAGIETHVCVQQTVLDLLAGGFRAYVAADASGARFEQDRDVALRRMESSGATITTTEAALFELCEVAGTPQFKALSQLIRQTPPA